MYQGAWPQNIGNAFFDFGSEAIIRLAFPDARIVKTGGAVHWMFNNSGKLRTGLIGKIIRKMFPDKHFENGNSIEIAELINLDLLVFAGMSMTEEFVLNNGRTLIEANRNGVSILGIGLGGSRYNEREVQIFSNFFNSLTKSALITRDDDTYELYKNHINIIEKGIDCGFFLPDYFPAPIFRNKKYEVYTFDFMAVPKSLKTNGKKIYYAHHDLWGYLPKKYTNTRGTLVSDVPEDYLSLYSNCDVTYSDRVHACVASLAYGNSAQLFNSTPRKALFAKLNVTEINQEPVKLDMQLLKKLKDHQISIVKNLAKGVIKNG